MVRPLCPSDVSLPGLTTFGLVDLMNVPGVPLPLGLMTDAGACAPCRCRWDSLRMRPRRSSGCPRPGEQPVVACCCRHRPYRLVVTRHLLSVDGCRDHLMIVSTVAGGGIEWRRTRAADSSSPHHRRRNVHEPRRSSGGESERRTGRGHHSDSGGATALSGWGTVVGDESVLRYRALGLFCAGLRRSLSGWR